MFVTEMVNSKGQSGVMFSGKKSVFLEKPLNYGEKHLNLIENFPKKKLSKLKNN